MWAPRLMLRAFVLAIVWLGAARAPQADDGAFVVIVNPETRTDAIDRDFLRGAYLKKIVEWGEGEAIHPVDLPTRYPARDAFTEQVIRKTPAQLRAYWNQQIFSGKGTPPPEVSSPQDAIAYVIGTPGAIGYIPANVDPGRAKVVRVK
jgi:ABC-type phosphate transport system substrate-binding protein